MTLKNLEKKLKQLGCKEEYGLELDWNNGYIIYNGLILEYSYSLTRQEGIIKITTDNHFSVRNIELKFEVTAKKEYDFYDEIYKYIRIDINNSLLF